MTPLFQQLGIEQLSTVERLELIGSIWDSVSDEVEDAPLTEVQRQEIDRRLAAHAANPNAAVAWEQVEAEARLRLNR